MQPTFQHHNDLLGLFAKHPVAANLVMLVMVLSGIMALSRLNTQFFPNFEMEIVSVRTVWSGATAEDVERSVTAPLEQSLRSTDGLDKMTSTSSQGLSTIQLEFPEGTEMGEAVARVDELVKGVRNLPQDAERPEVSHVIGYEPIAKLLVHGPSDSRELRWLARRFERELLSAGISKVSFNGLPEEELAIQVPMQQLEALGMDLRDVADRVGASSRDLPAGTLGRDDVGRQVRAISQGRSEGEFEALPLVTSSDGRLIRVGDVAEVTLRPRTGQPLVSFQGKPAVELTALRAKSGDSLESARVIQEWLVRTRAELPPDVEITVYDESWQLIQDRISLLVKNGLSGLIVVVLILFLFLNAKVAGWVTLGIPISFLGTLALLYLAGGSINMISLFALIMTLGIIVDDAIVVGEDALTHYQTGESSLEAAEGGARRMIGPVLSSSLTTIAAFIPLMVISGIIGKILKDIPFVVICVIFASLVECFLVLPGHLRHSFLKMHHDRLPPYRERFDRAFDGFRNGRFRRWVTLAVGRPGTTLAIALSSLILIGGLIGGGRLGFTFFPSVEGNILVASASFVSGTPPDRVEALVEEMERGLYRAEQSLGGSLVRTAVVSQGSAYSSDAMRTRTGEQFANVVVELVPSDTRDVRNETFLEAWKQEFPQPPGLENLTMASRKGGPPGSDLEISLTGVDPEAIKAAGEELNLVLEAIPGVSGLQDDMPFGKQQLVFELTPLALTRGLTVADVARQLRAALDGELAQIYTQGEDEIEVRAVLPDSERYRLATLGSINIFLPQGGSLPLQSVVTLQERRGFEVLRHRDGRLALSLSGNVNRAINNADRIRAQLAEEVLPQLTTKYGVEWAFTGRAEEQADTIGDMKQGALFALAMIYIVLAWVFGSYGWPLVVMSVIPFGIVGAIFGHWVMGIELTILSMFGLFGLSGIVVNDSIILVVFYKHLREAGMDRHQAIVEAACRRLRAVLLTSLTTIGGLTPLLFETSLQAQFLIPMAVSISFGLAFTTVLVLFLIPTLLSIHENLRHRLGLKGRWVEQGTEETA